MKDYVRLCKVSENQLKNTWCDVLLVTIGIQQPKHHLQYTSCIATFNDKGNIHRHFCRGGLVVGRPTAVREDLGLNLTTTVAFITTVTEIYSLGHGLCTLTAVPRSTQPSTFRGTVKGVSAYELSNSNKWRWCLRMVAANLSADSQPKSVGLV